MAKNLSPEEIAFRKKRRDYFFLLLDKSNKGLALSEEEKSIFDKLKPLFLNQKDGKFGQRASFHDYREKRCYHIILKKDDNFKGSFARVAGDIHSSRNIQIHHGKRANQYRRISFAPNILYKNISQNENEDIPRTILNDTGILIYQQIKGIEKIIPCNIFALCIMPDHVHAVINVKERINNSIIYELSRIKNNIRKAAGKKLLADKTVDIILSSSGQLNTLVDYVNDNPRRYLIKSQYPDLFRRINNIKAFWSPLTITYENFIANNSEERDNQIYLQSFGNPFILKRAEIFYVKFSKKFTQSQRLEWEKNCEKAIKEKSVLVSAFIHPIEKKLETQG